MELTPDTLHEVSFREKLRGYHPDDVDEFLEQVAEGVRELREELRHARERAVEVERRPAPQPENEEAVRRTLVLAQRTADMAVKEARDQAVRMVAEATEEARRIAEESQRQLRADVQALEAAREQLKADVAALQHYVDQERTRLSAALKELVKRVEQESGPAPPPPALHRPLVPPPARPRAATPAPAPPPPAAEPAPRTEGARPAPPPAAQRPAPPPVRPRPAGPSPATAGPERAPVTAASAADPAPAWTAPEPAEPLPVAPEDDAVFADLRRQLADSAGRSSAEAGEPAAGGQGDTAFPGPDHEAAMNDFFEQQPDTESGRRPRRKRRK